MPNFLFFGASACVFVPAYYLCSVSSVYSPDEDDRDGLDHGGFGQTDEYSHHHGNRLHSFSQPLPQHDPGFGVSKRGGYAHHQQDINQQDINWKQHHRQSQGEMPALAGAQPINPDSPWPPHTGQGGGRGVLQDIQNNNNMVSATPVQNRARTKATQPSPSPPTARPNVLGKNDASDPDTRLVLYGKPFTPPKGKRELHLELVKMVKHLELVRTKYEHLCGMNQALQDELTEMKKTTMKSLKNAKTEARIKKLFASHMFRRRKFINNLAEQEEAGNEMFDFYFSDKERKKFPKDYKTTWVNTYMDTVTTTCNKRRTTIQGALRSAIMAFAEKHKRHISMAEIAKCIFRDIDLKNPNEVLVFKWYWTELLGKHLRIGHYVGQITNGLVISTNGLSCHFFVFAAKTVGPDVWEKKQMTKTTLLAAKNPQMHGNKLMFPPSTEAFCYIMLANNADKWERNIKLYLEKNNTFRTHLPPKQVKPKNGPRPPDPHHDAKYTDKDGGQQQFGTFSKEGLKEFEAIRMQIFTKRKKDGKEMFAFEKKFLADHLKLPAKTGKVAAGKRKSAGDGPGNPKHAKIIVLEESDEEWDPSAAAPHSNHANSTTNRRAEKTPDNNSDDDSEDDSDDDN